MDSNYIIETKNLTKQYGSQKSVADLNIHVKRDANANVLLNKLFKLTALQSSFSVNCIFCREWDGKTAHLNVLMLTRIIIVSYIAVQVPRTIIATLLYISCLGISGSRLSR